MSKGLMRELFGGPIDIVGDVHGEIRALRELVRRLGYDEQGRHPEGRRLVFVGDLGDRGEDSPAVVEWVRDRVLEGRAQAVLGNHDFNALEAAAGGEMKTELSWLFDEAPPYRHHDRLVPQAHASPKQRDDVLAFFRSLPVALERGGELPARVVHAAWDSHLVERLRPRRDVVAAYREEKAHLQRVFDHVGLDAATRTLLHQNCNAVKHLTSGVEVRSPKPIYINEKPRWELRHAWWHQYRDPVLCVIGHYWRILLPGEVKFESLFDGLPLEATHGGGPVLCIDYSAGKRFRERLGRDFDGSFRTRLGALRLPEKQIVYDNAEPVYLKASGGC
jgi:hypothetical protein